ncbi:hypothetical protein BDB01DRAFT_830931 [Pilobolus umbonatus]|nr:hypothetical protein BDB01DRAFT_830931 [Pilobolus umbonatus]
MIASIVHGETSAWLWNVSIFGSVSPIYSIWSCGGTISLFTHILWEYILDPIHRAHMPQSPTDDITSTLIEGCTIARYVLDQPRECGEGHLILESLPLDDNSPSTGIKSPPEDAKCLGNPRKPT